ncbi:twin-arginine translocation signal domain-containing protein, partial [Cronobacter sakazakii]|nr:twin-arginine translocation signal domain-containing protein [Cronobacter sakazakii]
MEPLTPKDEPDESGLSRRDFLRATSALAAAPLFVQAGVAKAQTPEVEAQETETVVPTCSTFDCGGKCDIRAHVKEGVVTRISTCPDNEVDPDMPLMRACVRGRGYRQFVYHPDRLKYPMKRVGKRGEG